MYKIQKVGTPILWVMPGLGGVFLLVAFLLRPFDWASPMGILGGVICMGYAVYFFMENRRENRELPQRQKEFDALREALWGSKK